MVTEPFSEWVLQGDFPAGRPRWEAAGARFVDDLEPYERRKLWLLNAGHSLLAYEGLARGLTTVADAFADPTCRAELEQLWSEAAEVLTLPADDATAALRTRFANARIEHRLAQIARDGSVKLPVRILAVAQARAVAGLPVGPAGAGVVAAWIDHLDGAVVRPRCRRPRGTPAGTGQLRPRRARPRRHRPPPRPQGRLRPARRPSGSPSAVPPHPPSQEPDHEDRHRRRHRHQPEPQLRHPEDHDRRGADRARGRHPERPRAGRRQLPAGPRRAAADRPRRVPHRGHLAVPLPQRRTGAAAR